MIAEPRYIVPIDDGSAPAQVEVRSERVVPPCVLVDLGAPSRLMTPTEAAQLGQALQDAARDAGAAKAKGRGRR